MFTGDRFGFGPMANPDRLPRGASADRGHLHPSAGTPGYPEIRREPTRDANVLVSWGGQRCRGYQFVSESGCWWGCDLRRPTLLETVCFWGGNL